MIVPTINWQPAKPPFGLFSFVPPESNKPDDEVDGRVPLYGVLDAEGMPVWQDKAGKMWSGPWPAEAEAKRC